MHLQRMRITNVWCCSCSGQAEHQLNWKSKQHPTHKTLTSLPLCLISWVCSHCVERKHTDTFESLGLQTPPSSPLPPQQTQQEIWFQTQNLVTLLRYFSFPQPSDKTNCCEVGWANSAMTGESGGILPLRSGFFHSHCSVIPLHITSLKCQR